MSGVVSVCPVHGAFESSAFEVNNAYNVTIVNSREECPRCGADSRVMEGTFTFRNGLVEVLSSPDWTVEALLEARKALQDLDLSRVRTPREALRKLEKTSPAAAQLLQKAKGNGWTRSDKIAALSIAVTSVLTILNVIVGQLPKEAPKPSVEEIARIVKVAMDQADASKN